MTVSTTHDIVAIRADVASGMAWQQLGAMPHVSIKELWSSEGAAAGLLRIDPHAREVAHLHSHGRHHLWVLDGHVEINGIGLPDGQLRARPGRRIARLDKPRRAGLHAGLRLPSAAGRNTQPPGPGPCRWGS